MERCTTQRSLPGASIGLPCLRSLPMIPPSSHALRNAPHSWVRNGTRKFRCTANHEQDAQSTINSQQKARQAVLVAMLSIAAAIGLPFQAEAKKAEPPPPPPTAYDELQKIISGRSGNTGSLLESFKKTVTAPVSGLVESVQPTLPAAPQLAGPKASEAKSGSPLQGNAAVREVQRGADQAVEASPELGSSQPLLFAVAAAVLGFGGYKVFTGRQGEVASKPRSAAKSVKRPVQRQAGTKKIGGAAKQAAKKAPQPVKSAFQSTKAKSQGPAKKSSGGLFGIGRASSPKQAAKKVAPKATKKIQRSGTKKIATQKAGTKRIGGTKAIGTRRTGAAQPASRRLQLDDDTSSTLGAAGVVGLGVAVAAFVAFNLTVDDSATAQEAVKEAVSKLTDVPAVIADAGKGQQDVIASTQTAAPEVRAPDAGAPVQEAKQKLEKVPNAVASVAEKASDEAAKAAPKPDPVAKVAEKAEGQGTPEKPAEVPAPDPLEPKTEPQAATGQIAAAANKDGPQAVAEVAKTPEAEALVSRTPEESLTKPAPAVQRSPDTTTLRKGAVEDASRQKASQTALQTGDQPKRSQAFEAAAKKLSSGQSSADMFAKTRAEEQKKFEAESQKVADKVAGKQPQTASKKGAAPSPSKATQAAGQAAQGGGSSGLILGGLAAAAVVGIAVAAPKDKAADAANEAASAAKDSASSAKESIQSTGASGNSSSGGGGDVKDDIASRKKDAQKWISDWRQETGGK